MVVQLDSPLFEPSMVFRLDPTSLDNAVSDDVSHLFCTQALMDCFNLVPDFSADVR